MWHILKAELSYKKYLLMTAFGSTFVFSIIMENNTEASQWLSWLPFYFVASYFITLVQKEKRDRLYMLLPVSVKEIGRARIALFYILYAAIALFWLPGFLSTYNLLVEHDSWVFFTTSVFILAVFVASFVFIDIVNTRIKKFRNTFFIAVAGYAVLVVLLFVFFVSYQDEQNVPVLVAILLKYPVIPFVSLLPLPVLFYSAVKIFSLRQSYMGGKKAKCGWC